MEDFEYKDAYFSAKERVNILREDMQKYYVFENKNDLLIDDVLRFSSKSLGIIIKKYDNFNSLTSKILSGTLFINPVNGKSLISYNSLMPYNRQNFTKLHELFHFLQHQSGDSYNYQYSDLLAHKGYSEEMLPEEVEANYGASLLFCTDDKLLNLVWDDNSFSRISRELKMSEVALSIRLINFLCFERNIAHYVAQKIVEDFSDHNNNAEIKLALLYGESDLDKNEMLETVANGLSYYKNFNFYNDQDELPF